jgi:hypothetical protein
MDFFIGRCLGFVLGVVITVLAFALCGSASIADDAMDKEEWERKR